VPHVWHLLIPSNHVIYSGNVLWIPQITFLVILFHEEASVWSLIQRSSSAITGDSVYICFCYPCFHTCISALFMSTGDTTLPGLRVVCQVSVTHPTTLTHSCCSLSLLHHALYLFNAFAVFTCHKYMWWFSGMQPLHMMRVTYAFIFSVKRQCIYRSTIQQIRYFYLLIFCQNSVCIRRGVSWSTLVTTKNAVAASSRSGSPSSRLSYATYSATNRDGGPVDGVHTVGRPRRLSSGIPRSTGTSREASRETSPNRFGLTGIHDRSFGSKLRWGSDTFWCLWPLLELL
jgi:hypothetical protein